jgi:hypothetical protein
MHLYVIKMPEKQYVNFFMATFLKINLKKKTSIKNKIATYIHQIYNNGLLKLKNMD